jgi:hypothetical protein
VKLGLVKISSVKGYASDLLCFVEDIMFSRTPVENLVKDPVEHHLPQSLKASYIQEVRNFFSTYKPSEEDNMKLINDVLLEPQVYEVLKLLREAIVTRNDLMKLVKKGVEDVDKVLRTLWDNRLISVFQDDKAVEYYCLLCDVNITRFFPRYILDSIRAQFRNKSQNPNALVKALLLMKEEYYILGGRKPTVPRKKKVKVASDDKTSGSNSTPAQEIKVK